MDRVAVGSVLLAALLGVACAEEISKPGTWKGPTGSPSAAAAAAAKPKASSDAPPAVEFQETDFTESERSRDPFRSFAKSFAEEARSKVKSQREVVLDQYSVDELKLVGLVTRIQPERALVIDPTGKGHILVRGQFVGRAEVVQGGASGAEYEINWRVERIRDSDIVLVRDDPTNPDVPSATRIVPLRAEGSEEQAALLQ
ncbi:MAG TPA: pilus assembly protein PilP [Polyangiaceae bacterium]|nr:pilus assembly protein PilP [Polyangiaceae bacterium]